MSEQVLRDVIGRLSTDPEFAAAVSEDAEAALSGLDLSVDEIARVGGLAVERTGSEVQPLGSRRSRTSVFGLGRLQMLEPDHLEGHGSQLLADRAEMQADGPGVGEIATGAAGGAHDVMGAVDGSIGAVLAGGAEGPGDGPGVGEIAAGAAGGAPDVMGAVDASISAVLGSGTDGPGDGPGVGEIAAGAAGGAPDVM